MKRTFFAMVFTLIVVGVNAQNIRTTSNAVGFSYTVDPMLTDNAIYNADASDLGALGAIIRDSIAKIRLKDKAVSIVAFLPADHNYNEKMVNTASLRAYNLREKLKSLYDLRDEDFVFAFDDRNDVRDILSLDVVERGAYQKSVIYYSMSSNLSELNFTIDKYEGVPFFPARLPSLYITDIDDIKRSYDNYMSKKKEIVEVVVIVDNSKSQKEKQEFVPFRKNPIAPIVSLKIDALALAGFTPYFELGKVTPNLEVEGYMSNFFSLSVSGAYMKYYKGEQRDCQRWRFGNVSFEPRFWLNNRKAFRGVYVGVYGEYLNFDIKNPNIASGSRVDGEGFTTGISVGYFQPIVGGLGIEAAVRGGYVDYCYDKYSAKGVCKNVRASGIDLTQVRVSLVYRFGKRDVTK